MVKYIGRYNWQGEIIKLWTHAKNPEAAHRQFTAKLSEILGVSNYRLRCYFGGGKDNYSVKAA